jgi:hypothetical protein
MGKKGKGFSWLTRHGGKFGPAEARARLRGQAAQLGPPAGEAQAHMPVRGGGRR